MKKRIKKVDYTRKRKGKTDYKRRLRLLLSSCPRLVIRKSLKNMTAQLVEYSPKGDKVLVCADTKQLNKLGWKTSSGNIPAAYLVGIIVGKKAVKKGLKKAVVDIGLQPSIKGSRIYAVVKGAIDAGMEINYDDKMSPQTERLAGKHLPKGDVEKQINDIKNKI